MISPAVDLGGVVCPIHAGMINIGRTTQYFVTRTANVPGCDTAHQLHEI